MERRYFRIKELLQILNISKSTLYRLSKTENFPRPIRLSRKIVMYDIKEIHEWLETRRGGKGDK